MTLEEALIAHMQETMRHNIEMQCYTNAIFFADKVVNLFAWSDSFLSLFLSLAPSPYVSQDVNELSEVHEWTDLVHM